MKIASYNVNGINGRLPILLRWLKEAKPDVVCLQELKAPNDKFPLGAIQEAGYGAIWHGQKSWNGVAILARGSDPLETRRGLPGDPDEKQSRYLEAAVQGVLIGCLYLPNGNPAPGPKFNYKLQWFDRFLEYAAGLLSQRIPVVLAGDYNVMPTELDVYKPASWLDDALFREEVRERFAKLVEQGWTDSIRSLHPDERIYTFWDYLRNAYGRNAGLRLDHFLLSPQLASRLKKAQVDKEVRGWEHSSDHAPAWIELASGPAAKKRSTKKAKVSPAKEVVAAPLEKYRAKRNFDKTPEPGPKIPKRSGKSFVVHEHHARRHHYDLRLEIDGVMVSWAVPKEIPEDLVAKRLAVHVEDHPLDYGKFEGEIPKGNYGAGKVSIWDKGEWQPLEKDWRAQFAKGTLKFQLRGDRLNAPYILARMKEEPNWMLKMLNHATHPLSTAVAPEREQARFIEPQLAHVVASVPTGKEWIHELKFDGYRLIAVQNSGELRIFTRSGLDWTDKFRTLAGHLAQITQRDFVLDGEAVVFDEQGRTRFGDLQEALTKKHGGNDIVFMAFDLLHLDGLNLRDLPLSARLKRLDEMVTGDQGSVRRSMVWASEFGASLFQQAAANGLEGIMSKELSGPYRSGSRREWTKSKVRPRQEFVVCGYTPPKSSLPGFSSLVLGSMENGRLVPRGNVGTGFTEAMRMELVATFKPLVTKRSPFEKDERGVIWLRPELVAEIEYAEITREGSIRQGSFIALREDKASTDVHLDGIQKATADPEGKVAGIKISHPDRIIYPAEQITKMEVVLYYERVGELMLPWVANRPLAIIRSPEGITGEMFFQKNFPNHIPPHVEQKRVDSETEVFFIKDVRGLVALAQFGAIEIHPWGSPMANVETPDTLIWDLDPHEDVPWQEVLGAAFLLRDFLAERGLKTVVKTSGGKGLHIVLRLKRKHEWPVMKEFTKAVSNVVAAYNPRRFITKSTKAGRAGKIFIDYLRNGRGATCVVAYGLRGRPGATVSMPINWEQLPAVGAAGFTIHTPPENPQEWRELKPQAISQKVLKEFGLG